MRADHYSLNSAACACASAMVLPSVLDCIATAKLCEGDYLAFAPEEPQGLGPHQKGKC